MNSIIPCYELVGFINLYNTIPGFIYPIFSAFNKFYFQDGKSIYIEKFYEVHIDLSEKIIFLKDLFFVKKNSINLPKMFNENSLSVYAYQQSKDCFFMGDIVSFYNFMNQQKKNVLIDDFLSENCSNYKLAQKRHIESWSCKMSSTFLKTAPVSNLFNINVYNLEEKSFEILPMTCTRIKKNWSLHDDLLTYYFAKIQSRNEDNKTYDFFWNFSSNNTFYIEDDNFRSIEETNISLYNKFCELIDEYSNVCINVSSENQKIEFVEKLLKKKKWLLTPTQYKIIINSYGKNYLWRKEYAYAINYSDLIEENKALKLLNQFLMDVIEDKNINTFDSIYNKW